VQADPATIESLLNRFRALGLHLDIERDTYEGNKRVVTFTKVTDRSREKIAHYLSGGTIDE
jgi:ATP-dependent RNA circularization protein (DNA/RNA ligase family)